MSFLVLDAVHKTHLKFLASVDNPGVAEEFARISVEFLRSGVHKKIYSSAAKKLGTSSTNVKNSVQGLMFLFAECSKLKVSELDFRDSILVLGLPEDVNASLCQVRNPLTANESLSAHILKPFTRIDVHGEPRRDSPHPQHDESVAANISPA